MTAAPSWWVVDGAALRMMPTATISASATKSDQFATLTTTPAGLFFGWEIAGVVGGVPCLCYGPRTASTEPPRKRYEPVNDSNRHLGLLVFRFTGLENHS